MPIRMSVGSDLFAHSLLCCGCARQIRSVRMQSWLAALRRSATALIASLLSSRKKKRGAEIAPAAAASAAAAEEEEPEDRRVKQRCDSAAAASSGSRPQAHSEALVFGVPESSAASSSGLTRLPSVLVHLVMQQLKFEELARLASTCRLMRADSLHPSVGRNLLPDNEATVSLNPPPSASDVASASHWARDHMRAEQRVHSSLGRAHLPVTISTNVDVGPKSSPELIAMSQSERVAALVEKIAGWAHVESLSLDGARDWSEQDALTFLQSPAIQRVQRVEGAAGVWMRESVQTALCRLPLLESLDVDLDDRDHPSLRLHPSAFAHATALRSLKIGGVQVPTFHLAGLVSVSNLTSLEMQVQQYTRYEDAERKLLPWLMRHCKPMLSKLRALKLTNVCLAAYGQTADLFRAMPALRYLETDNWYPDHILRSLIHAGAAAMPDLRVVRFWQDRSGDSGGDGDLTSSLLRKMLKAFPRVKYCLTICGDGDEQMVTREEYEGWSQVCTQQNHAPAGPDGIAGKCTNDDDDGGGAEADDAEAASDKAPADAAEGDDGEEDDDDAEVAEDDGGDEEGEDEEEAPLDSAQSLALIDADYQRAIKTAGEWAPAKQA